MIKLTIFTCEFDLCCYTLNYRRPQFTMPPPIYRARSFPQNSELALNCAWLLYCMCFFCFSCIANIFAVVVFTFDKDELLKIFCSHCHSPNLISSSYYSIRLHNCLILCWLELAPSLLQINVEPSKSWRVVTSTILLRSTQTERFPTSRIGTYPYKCKKHPRSTYMLHEEVSS